MIAMNFKHIPLTQEQKIFCKQHLIRSSKFFKKWEVFYSKRLRCDFRRKILAGNNNPFGLIPDEKMAELQADLPAIRFPRNAKCEELGQRTIEEAVLSGFSLLCMKHARNWTIRENVYNSNDYLDFLHEAYATILMAMYLFNREDISLTTFFWRSIHNRMMYTLNRRKFFRLKNNDLKLFIEYHKRASRSSDKLVTFEEIVKEMGLDQKTANHLSGLLVKIQNSSECMNGDCMNGDNENSDYTGFRAGIDRDNSIEEIEAKLTIDYAIEHSGLNEMEKIIIEHYLRDNSVGWHSRLAKTLINPKTGKNYSRMWIVLAKESAINKLRKCINFRFEVA